MRTSAQQAASQESELSRVTIKQSVPKDSPIESLVAFPNTEYVRAPQIPGHIRCVALLRLVDGTVWMLSMPGRVWADQRLKIAAETLSDVSANAYSKAPMERLLRTKLQNESVCLERPVIDSVDLRQWAIRETAYYLAKQPVGPLLDRSTDEREGGLWLSSIEKALLDGLDDALQEFVEGMEPRELDLSSTGGQLNHRLYNYLVYVPFRQFRNQFAETFPSLLLTSVLPEKGELGTELRSIVDSGAPVIKTLADRWKVRPGVIRHLVGKLAGHVGVQWSRDARGLALVLNALRPGDLPGDAVGEWSEFNHMVAVGQRLFCRRIWDSTAALKWLRECVSRSRRGTREALEVWLPNWDQIPNILRLRDAAALSLRRDIADLISHSAGSARDIIIEAVDSLILNMASSDVAFVASRFIEEVRVGRREIRIEDIVSGESLLPLFPGEFISRDGTRDVRPLTTRLQLRFHGIEIRNCLATDSMGYARKAAAGKNFIVGIFHKRTGKALSTAEISVRQRTGAGRYYFAVRQHTAKNNAEPSQPCKRAIADLRYFCQSDEVLEHLEYCWRQMRSRRIAYRRTKQLETDRALTDALRRTLTDVVYDELLATVRVRLEESVAQ